MRALYSIIFLVGFCALGYSQPIASYKMKEMYTTAEQQMDLGDYFNALDWYKKIYKEEKTPESALSIGYAYYKMRDYKNAQRWYGRVLDEDVDNIFINDRYAYGKVLRAMGEPTAAKQELEKLMSMSDDEELRALARLELDGINSEKGLAKNDDVIIRFGGEKINSGSGEYSPMEYDDKTLYFSSFNRRKEIVLDGEESGYHAKIYRSTRGKEGYEKPEELDQKINRPGYHVSGVCFSKDKRTMYFARQTLQNDKIVTSTIYSSNMGSEDWSAAEPVAVINGDFITMQPAVGELFGNEVLFFVSDRDGGLGGYDIYYSSITGAGLSAPVNLGESINTAGDDISPFYHDGNLYYSTDGRPGMGNYDLFSSEWDGNQWSAATNMGKMYNTRYDDFSLSFNSGGTKGYLVSNRPDEKKKKLKSETCCYDIYAFDIKELQLDLLVGVGHMEEEKEKPLNGATVQLYDRTIEDIQTQTQEEEYRFGFDLFPERKYEVIVSKEGYISDTLEVNTGGITEDTKIRKKVVLKKAAPAEPDLPEYTLETVTINEPIRLNNIYYNFEKWDILPDAEQDLQIILDLMNQYDDMVIELSSHTDSRGTTPYNKNLSQKRAQSAKDWLTQKGIAESRIQAVGYGESKILNKCTNGTRCSDEEHRFNRRTEFKIVAGPQTIQIKREVKKDDHNGGKQSFQKPVKGVPVMTFKKNNIDIGTMKAGEKKKIVFEFENTGTDSLVIDLATACKCTEITWPMEPMAPGAKGEIIAIFDSAGMEGPYTKTIDIIANTEPIVVEAKFIVEIKP